jgi:hypothetical protein
VPPVRAERMRAAQRVHLTASTGEASEMRRACVPGAGRRWLRERVVTVLRAAKGQTSREMSAVRFVVAITVLFALLVRPSLWPFVAASLLITLLVTLFVSLWSRRQPEQRARLAGVAAVLAVLAVAAIGVIAVLLVRVSARDGKPGATKAAARPPLSVRVVYVAHLTLTHTRDLRAQESVRLLGPRGVPLSLTPADLADGWRAGALPNGERGYVRLTTRHINVPDLLPAERTNRFVRSEITVMARVRVRRSSAPHGAATPPSSSSACRAYY